jgi:glucose-1-phosphate thymidylyltransferase
LIKKGIILAGGSGSRLYPLTVASNKQLLPIYDKPVIYYPLTTLMLAGIKDILIISSSHDLPSIQKLLGDGANLGMNFSYLMQEKPNGLPEAFILGKKFIDNDNVAMILGDNFFHGHGLASVISEPTNNFNGCHLFTYNVDDPERYGVVVLDNKKNIIDIEEKPKKAKSNLAITGLYYFDGSVAERAKKFKPSARGELEIVDLIKSYMSDEITSVTQLARGFVWLDAGTPKSLLEASQYVEVIQTRQGNFIASPEEVALNVGFINKHDFENQISKMPKSKYQEYLLRLV